MIFYSPLRYPGGKNKLSVFIAKICVDTKINGFYVEPYAGGASVALFLLFESFVNKIIINDKDRSIYAFWYSVLNRSEELCELIDKTEISINNWHKLKEVQIHKEKAGLLELGFSTLFLNRTNRSGLLNGGPIGGYKQQGDYRINCRFNKEEIKLRVKKIASRKEDIKLYNEDALDLIDRIQKEIENKNVICYFDPPYYHKASTLYMNHYTDENHRIVSERIKRIKGVKWIVSYDNVTEIKELYRDYESKEYSFNHTAYKIREGKEILIFNFKIEEPDIKDWNPIRYKYLINNTTASIVYK
jgi:DNA adenine methylase